MKIYSDENLCRDRVEIRACFWGETHGHIQNIYTALGCPVALSYSQPNFNSPTERSEKLLLTLQCLRFHSHTFDPGRKKWLE